eukprot:scaffold647975_cov38-Prasinocladus_malaysianus.AAC.1
MQLLCPPLSNLVFIAVLARRRVATGDLPPSVSRSQPSSAVLSPLYRGVLRQPVSQQPVVCAGIQPFLGARLPARRPYLPRRGRRHLAGHLLPVVGVCGAASGGHIGVLRGLAGRLVGTLLHAVGAGGRGAGGHLAVAAKAAGPRQPPEDDILSGVILIGLVVTAISWCEDRRRQS